MRTVLGVICVVFGGFGFVSQTLSWTNLQLAQRLGFQERSEEIDKIYQNAEINTAKWDSVVLWTLLVAGILMITNNSWWPFISLLAGGIYIDTAGREAAKYMSLLKSNVKVGTDKNIRIAVYTYFSMAIIALWVILYSIWFISMKDFV